MGAAITALRNTPALRWANPLEVKNAVESALADRFGAKEATKPKSKVRPLASPSFRVGLGRPLLTHACALQTTGTEARKACRGRGFVCCCFYAWPV